MGFFSSTPATQTTTQNTLNTFQPDQYWLNDWGAITGTASGLASYPINNYYTGQRVADPSQLTNQYWGNAQAYGNLNPTIQPAQGTLQQLSGDIYNTQANPQGIQMPGYGQWSFQPNQSTLPGIAAWGQKLFSQTPQVSGPQGISGLASSYYVQPNQVSAPNSVSPISGLLSVTAPQLTQYQMGPAQQTATRSFTQPGTAAQYMSPYTQQVVNAQLAQAQVQEQQQLQQQAGQAAQAGAFGGSRQAVEAANTSIGYQQLAANLQAQGLQNAFANAQQQFNTEQGLGLQSQMANQQAGLTVGGQNLAAQLQTQGLGAQLGMQGQLANQQTGLSAALANQQAQEFGAGQNMQAQLANQAAGIQTGLAAQQMGLQGAISNAQLGLQSQEANQAAILQGLGMQYTGGLQGALQEQQLQLQGQVQGAQLGVQSAAQQYQLRQAQQQLNQQAIMNAGNLQQASSNVGLAGYYAGLQGQQSLAQAALSQQGYDQSLRDAQLATYLQNIELPMQALGWQAGIQQMMNPLIPYYTTGQSTSTTTGTPYSPSILSQALSGALSALGAYGLSGLKARKGGLAPTGLETFQGSRYRSHGNYNKGLGHFAKAA